MNDPFSPDSDEATDDGFFGSVSGFSKIFERFSKLTEGTSGESAKATAEFASDLAPTEDSRENFLIMGRIWEGTFDKLDRVFNEFQTGDPGEPTDSEQFVDRLGSGEPLATGQILPGPLRDISQQIEEAKEKITSLLETMKNFGDSNSTGDGGAFNPLAEVFQTLGAVADTLEEKEFGTIFGGLGKAARTFGEAADGVSSERVDGDFRNDPQGQFRSSRGDEGPSDQTGLLKQLNANTVSSVNFRPAFTALSQIDYSAELQQLRVNVEKLRSHTAVANPN